MRTEPSRPLAQLFEDGPASDDYALIRDDTMPEIVDARAALEAMWQTYAPHADRNFRAEAKKHFRARFWEMYLFSVLDGSGLSPRGQRGAGPDFVIETAVGRASVEAVAATAGQGKDQVPDLEYDVAHELPSRELLLRLTAALDEKSKKASKYLKTGFLSEDEPFAIAINGAVNGYAMAECRTPEGYRMGAALFRRPEST